MMDRTCGIFQDCLAIKINQIREIRPRPRYLEAKRISLLGQGMGCSIQRPHHSATSFAKHRKDKGEKKAIMAMLMHKVQYTLLLQQYPKCDVCMRTEKNIIL